MGSKKFTNEDIKKIARRYIFGKNMTYKKLAEMYGCSDSKISHMMNHELEEISKILFILLKFLALVGLMTSKTSKNFYVFLLFCSTKWTNLLTNLLQCCIV